MLNISKSRDEPSQSKRLNRIIKEGWKNLKYAKVLNGPEDKSWSVRVPGESPLFPEWKQHLFQMRFYEEKDDRYYECLQHIVCYDAVPGGEDSVTCTYENGCFFCIGVRYDVHVQEIYDIEHIWQWIENDDDKLAVKKQVLENWKNEADIWGDIRCKVEIMCSDCTKQRICILRDENDKPITCTTDTKKGKIEEEIGWCEKCGQCRRCRKEKKQPNKVTHRIYWTVGCSNSIEVTLCEDVCDDHLSIERDCPYSEKSRNFHFNKYTYL
jgi:hypothetical protein